MDETAGVLSECDSALRHAIGPPHGCPPAAFCPAIVERRGARRSAKFGIGNALVRRRSLFCANWRCSLAWRCGDPGNKEPSMSTSGKPPSKQQIRHYLQARIDERKPLPPMDEIRRQLGWELQIDALGSIDRERPLPGR